MLPVWGTLCILALILPTLQSRLYYTHSIHAEMEAERIGELAQGHTTELEPRIIELHCGSSPHVACGLGKMVMPPPC